MRQATQFGLDFAISPDETPHQRQCIHVLVSFRDESTPRRCLGLRIPRGSYCRAHAAHSEPCRCVYPDKCFCPPEAKRF